MSVTFGADRFVAINGPEDGAEFPVTRSPFTIGNCHTNAVNVTLDQSVERLHCHVTVVSEGYLIRGMGKARVYVDGKRATPVRSRIVRAAGVVQVGQTLLSLETSPEGLASRSRGIGAVNDFRWALETFFSGFLSLLTGLFHVVYALAARLITSKIAVGAALIAAYVFVPQVNYVVRWAIWNAYYRVITPIIQQFTN